MSTSAASLSSASSGSSSSGSSSGAGSASDDDIPAASTVSTSIPSGTTINMTDVVTPTSVEVEASTSTSVSSGEMIELPKSKLKLQGKALDKYKSMNPKMQELALEYCDSIVLQYVNGGQRKIQKEEAFLLKRLRDFGVYHHRSTSTSSSATTKSPGATGTSAQSNGGSSIKKAALSNLSYNTNDTTVNQGGEGAGQQQQQQQQSSQPQGGGEQTTGSQDFVLLPKSKMKIQGRALERYLTMPLDMRIKALEYCDTHMIQRRRGGGGGTMTGSASSNPNAGVPPIKDEVAYMDKRLKDFAAANDLSQHQQKQQQKQSNKNSKSNAAATKEQQHPQITSSSTTLGSATVPPTSTNNTTTSSIAITTTNTNTNTNTSTEVIVTIVDGDEVVELPKSKVRIRDNTLKRLRVMPLELQLRAIDYCDNIIISRKDTPDYIVNEQGFVATVIESFIKKWHNDEQKQPRGGGQQYKKKQQQQQGSTRNNPPSSPPLSSSRGGGGGGPSNRISNETNATAISSSSNSSSTSTTPIIAAGLALSTAIDGDIPPLHLPRSKLQVTGNPLQILSSLKDNQLRQQTIEYCDDVFMKKLQDKKSRPIENEMAYLASIIDAFLLNAQTMTTGITEINGNTSTSGGQQPQEDQNKNGGKETSSSSTTSSATAPTTTITTTLVELPVSKMKVIGHALQKLKSLPPPLQARAIQFCDQVLLRRENKSNKRKSRPIINETGYLASLIDNFLETQCTKEELASVSTYQQQQQVSSNSRSTPATPSSTTIRTGNGSMGTNDPSSSSAPATDDPSSYSTLIATLKQELEATKSKLDDKENETRDLSNKLEELQSSASSTTAKLRQETKDATNLLKDELTAAKAEAQKLQDMVKDFKATMSLKDDEIAKLSNEKTKLEEEASKMTETFSSMTKALVSTQEEKQEAIKFRDESEAKLSAKELELEKVQSALKSAESKLADEQWKVEQLKQSEKKNAANRISSEKQAMEKSRFLNFGGHHHQDISMFGTTAGVGGGGGDDDDADITEDEIPFDFSKIFDDENPLGLATDFQQPSASTAPSAAAAHSFHGSENNGHQHLTPTKGRDQL